jgi:hypothetical protein
MPLKRRERVPERSGRSQVPKALCRENRTLVVSVQLKRAAISWFFPLQFGSNDSPTVSDRLWDYYGNNRLDGGDGNDDLASGFGRDTLIGGRGDDTMEGGPGIDTYIPGMGNDVMDDSNGGWVNHDTYVPNWGGDIIDADIFILEKSLGPLGQDRIESFDFGFDVIEIQGYTQDQVVVKENRLTFSDGSILDVTMGSGPDGHNGELRTDTDFFFV